MKVKTAVLKEAVSKAARGVGNNKLLPITSMVGLEVVNGRLTFHTTDGTNHLYVSVDVEESEDCKAVVVADTLFRLIQRFTCDEVVFDIGDSDFKVRGNGNYRIEMPMDESGQVIRYPDPLAEFYGVSHEDAGAWEKSSVDIILNSIKPAVATTLEVPCYTGYYVGDSVVATNTLKIAKFDKKLVQTPMLISQDTMNLLSVFDAAVIGLQQDDRNVVFESQNVTLFADKMVGLDEYDIEAILGVVSTTYPFSCDVSKTELMQLLDRLALFVDYYDKNGINLRFDGEQLLVSSKASSAVESVDYIGEGGGEFACVADIEMLMQAIKAIRGSVLHIEYGVDNALKFTEDDVTMVIALLEEE